MSLRYGKSPEESLYDSFPPGSFEYGISPEDIEDKELALRILRTLPLDPTDTKKYPNTPRGMSFLAEDARRMMPSIRNELTSSKFVGKMRDILSRTPNDNDIIAIIQSLKTVSGGGRRKKTSGRRRKTAGRRRKTVGRRRKTAGRKYRK